MARDDIGDLLVFLAVARERSFTRAAAKLGVSSSAVSHTMRSLEERLGVRLLTRTTRSVSPTAAGERIVQTVGPRIDDIRSEIADIQELRDTPAGTIRITAIDHHIDSVLLPRLATALADYPDIKIEMHVDYGLSNIVADQYDIGVRWGDQVAQDMIAVRIAADSKLVVVGSPSYFATHPVPKVPKDLLDHDCITLRLPTHGGLYAWELKKGKREMQVRVSGRYTFNGAYQMLNAALLGAGLAFIPDDMAAPHLQAKTLRNVLDDWSPTFPGLHIYYPSRKASSRAMTVVVDALRFTAKPD